PTKKPRDIARGFVSDRRNASGSELRLPLLAPAAVTCAARKYCTEQPHSTRNWRSTRRILEHRYFWHDGQTDRAGSAGGRIVNVHRSIDRECWPTVRRRIKQVRPGKKTLEVDEVKNQERSAPATR